MKEIISVSVFISVLIVCIKCISNEKVSSYVMPTAAIVSVILIIGCVRDIRIEEADVGRYASKADFKSAYVSSLEKQAEADLNSLLSQNNVNARVIVEISSENNINVIESISVSGKDKKRAVSILKDKANIDSGILREEG